MVEILSRVSTISLARLRSTCKEWDALFKAGRLARKHSANAPKQSLALMLTGSRVYSVSIDLHGIQGNDEEGDDNKVGLKRQLISLKDPLCDSSKEVDIRSVSHCNGLLLCATEDDRLVVWNPVSGETKWIQPSNSSKSNFFFALGYDSKSSCYKIIMVSQDLHSNGTMFQADYEIYDFSSNTWSVVVSVTTNWFIQENQRRGVSVKENNYWLAYSLYSRAYKILISFDFTTERFQSHSLPHLYPFKSALSMVREDQLCLLGADHSRNVSLWMTSKIESTKAISWTKFLTSKTNFNNIYARMTSFLADEQNKVFVVCCSKNNYLQIVAKDKYIQVDLHSAESSRPYIFCYIPTLTQIQQRI